MFATTGIIMVYYNWLTTQLNELDYRIAVTKAIYNAESGIAEKAHPYLLQSNYVHGTVLDGRSLEVEELNLNMGSYRNVTMTKDNLYNELEERIKELHPYELPEIISVSIDKGLPKYLDWISESTK